MNIFLIEFALIPDCRSVVLVEEPQSNKYVMDGLINNALADCVRVSVC